MAAVKRCQYLFQVCMARTQSVVYTKGQTTVIQNIPRYGVIHQRLYFPRLQSTSASTSSGNTNAASSESDSDKDITEKVDKPQPLSNKQENRIKFIHTKLIATIKDDNINESDKETIVNDSIQRLLSLNYSGARNKFTNHALEHFVDRKLGTMEFEIFLNLLQFYLTQPNNTRMKDLLLHEALWRLNKCSISEMFKIAKLVSSDRSTKGEEVRQMCCERVRKGTKDILTAQDLGMAIKLVHGQRESAETVELLEETAFFFLTSMNSSQLCSLLYFMACNKTKNSILRKAVVREITKQKLLVSHHQLPDLFFACAVLNIHDENLLREMSEKAIVAIKSKKINKQRELYQILDACSKLGWCHQSLVCTLVENLNTSSVSEKRLSSAVISLAKLGVSNNSGLVQRLVEQLEGLRCTDPRTYVSVVHAAAALKQVSQQLLQSVLEPEFYRPLVAETTDVPSFVQDLVKEKLLHIIGCLHLDHGMSDSDFLPEAKEWRKHLQLKHSSKRESMMVKDLGRYLRGASLKDDHVILQQAQLDRYGNRIDFEVISKPQGSDSASVERVLIQVLGYDDMLTGGKEIVPNGFTAMSLRQLAANGDTVVMIPYYIEKKQWEDKLKDFIKSTDVTQKTTD